MNALIKTGLKRVASAILADVEPGYQPGGENFAARNVQEQSGHSRNSSDLSGRQDAALYGRQGCPPPPARTTLSRRDLFARFVRPLQAVKPVIASVVATEKVAVIQGRHCLALTSFCAACVERCPVVGAMKLQNGMPQVIADVCTGCGICRQVCPAPTNAVLMLPRQRAVASAILADVEPGCQPGGQDLSAHDSRGQSERARNSEDSSGRQDVALYGRQGCPPPRH